MKRFLKELPLPICGVMLGLAALGNLLQAVLTNLCGAPAAGNALHTLCGVLASLILLALILKIVCCFAGVKEAMQNSVVGSVSGTLPMALMLLSVYWKPALGGGAKAIWFFAIALHGILIVWFTYKFFRRPKLENIFASYFIVYVGIVVAAVSAPAYGMEKLGAGTFWFGLVCLLLLLILVTVRYVKVPVKEPAKPLVCIYAAPVSLCLAGYVQSVMPKSHAMLVGLLAVSTLILLLVLIQLPGLLKLPFYPSYSAFTFPFVITAIAALQCMVCLKKLGAPLPWLKPVVLAETVLATILVFYALIRYCINACKSKAAVK